MRGKLTVAIRLGLAFALVAALTAATCMVGLQAFHRLAADVRDASSHDTYGAVQLAHIQNAVCELRYGVSQFIANPRHRKAIAAAGECK